MMESTLTDFALCHEFQIQGAEYSNCRRAVSGDVGTESLMQQTVHGLNDDFSDWHLKAISDHAAFTAAENMEFFVRRTLVEFTEMKEDRSIRRDIWMGILTDELEDIDSFCRVFRAKLSEASLGNTVEVLENVKTTLLSFLHPSPKDEFDAAHVAQAVSDCITQLGSNPLFARLLSAATHYLMDAGSRVTGIPASWLASCLPSPSPHKFPSKKFFGQKHALAALENVLQSTRDNRDGHPLGIFFIDDPSNVLWEDFAKDISRWLYPTDNVSLRLDLSADADTLLMSANGKGKLCALFDDVKKRPFSVVVLEKVDKAHDAVIDAFCHCLTSSCTLEGSPFDFSRTVFLMVSDNCSSDGFPLLSGDCRALQELSNHSGKRLMGLALDNSWSDRRCRCMNYLREVKELLSSKVWDILDDVILLPNVADCHLMAYARALLREIATRFCGGRLTIYPSEAALNVALYSPHCRKGGRAIRQWLEADVAPKLKEMADRGDIDEKSVVYIDIYVGTEELSFRVEKVNSYLGDNISKEFSKVADYWRAIYRKGRLLEDITTRLRKRLVKLHTVINSNVEVECIPIVDEMQELIKRVDNAIDVANNINCLKEVFVCSVEEADAVPSVCKKAKIEVAERLRAAATSHSALPEMIEIVMGALLRKIDASEGSKISPSSFLLLGLRDDGKRELLVELERNFKDAGIHLLKVNLSVYSNEDSLSCPVACSSGSSSDGFGWLHLVETVKEHPYSILYFDQVERASMLLFSLLVSVLVHGVSMDRKGNMVDFGRTVIIIASNVGNKHVMAEFVRRLIAWPGGCQGNVAEVCGGRKAGRVGGQGDSLSPRSTQDGYRFRSELLIKVDEIVVFDPYVSKQMKSLARIPLANEQKSCKEYCTNLGDHLKWLFRTRDEGQYLSGMIHILVECVIKEREGTSNVA